jgi:hypothetical protein
VKTSLVLLLTIAALGLGAGTAHAQAGGPVPQPPPGPGLTAENPAVRNPGDTYDREMALARDEAVAKKRGERGAKPKGMRAVPAKPEDVAIGSEVRDTKGLVIGTIESLSPAAAVVVSASGKVEVPLEAFGKNSKGLVFGMTKEEFDKLVADANKPAG